MSTAQRDHEAPARPALPIDPRIKARRVQVKRDEGRRRLRLLLASAGTAVAVGVAALATRSPLLDIDHLTVTGPSHTSASQVLAAARLRPGLAMTDLQPGAAIRRIERLPWVSRAHVVKRWPATVVITVSERSPVALARSGNRWALVDRHARVLDAGAGPGPPVALPLVTAAPAIGRPGSTLGPGWGSALQVAQALPASLKTVVGSITSLDGGDLELHLLPRGTVRFGPPDDAAQKLASLSTLLTQVKLRGSIVIDVRVPDAPAVTPG